MDEHSENFKQRDRKYKKVPNRSHRAEEYNKWTEKYTKGVQQQARWNRRTDQWTGRQSNRTHTERAVRWKKKCF